MYRPILPLALLACGLPAAAETAAPVDTAAPTAANGLVDPAAEVLALEQERNQRLTVPVMVDGAGPYAFMIDTGSQATAITHEIRAALALPTASTAILVGMASRREVEMVDIGRLEFGTNSFTNFAAPVLESTHVGAEGIIGLDALQDFRVLVDFRNQTIAVEDASQKFSSSGFELVVRARTKLGQLLITDAVVEGVRATVIIDTGAQASLANSALRERIRAKRAQEVLTTDVNGVDLIGDLLVVRQLSIGGLAMTNVPLTFADTPAFEALGLKDQPTISLGMQHLGLFDRVAIDFAKQRVLFDLPRDIARAIRDAKRFNSYSANY